MSEFLSLKSFLGKSRFFLVLIAGLLLIFSCQETKPRINKVKAFTAKMLPSPASENSGEPNLFIRKDGRVFLSWVENTAKNSHALRFSRLENEQWSSPQVISEGQNWFVNWADFPSLAAHPNGLFAAHWLAKSGEATYAYDVNIALSNDSGKNWSSAFIPHNDGTETEHGFVSLLPWREDQFFATWLDGRNYAINEADPSQPARNEMTLRAAIFGKNGKMAEEWLLDERVCDCCQTTAAHTKNGMIVLYRDRSENEIRDISIVRYTEDKWLKPQTISQDNWKITGCPVNGPAVAATGKFVVAAWFTNVFGKPAVKATFSSDEGESFSEALTIDDGNPLGRVDVVLLENNDALVSWLETTAEGAEIRARKIQFGSSPASSITIAKTSAERASGFPIMVRQNNRIIFAYTEPGEPSFIKTAMLEWK